jgi:uncharacterized phiE125 gp8 family phage protein
MPHNQQFIKVNDYTLITGSNKEPITLKEVKAYLKIDGDDLDNDLDLFIDTVTRKAEQITGRDLLIKTYKGYLDCFPCSSSIGIQIQKSKLQSITSIQYLVDGVLTTFDSSNYYITDKQEYAEIWLFDGKTYPTDVDINRRQAVEITFTAGFGSKSCDIPKDLINAMLAHINLLNENRGDCADEKGLNGLITSLYMPYIISKKMVCII